MSSAASLSLRVPMATRLHATIFGALGVALARGLPPLGAYTVP